MNQLDTKFDCDQCDFIAENNEEMEIHKTEKHDAIKNSESIEICDIKLEIFCLVEKGNDVFETRKVLMDKLNDRKEVEAVEKVFVDKNEIFIDADGIQWNSVDIFLKTNEDSKLWNDLNFRRKIFSRCYLWDSFADHYGEKTRENLKKIKEEERLSEMRARGYLV